MNLPILVPLWNKVIESLFNRVNKSVTFLQ